MATFYGRLQGNRGEATRCGSKDSGIHASVESWSSVVRTRQFITGYTDRSLANLSIEGKYGGTGLTVTFNADAIALAARENNPELDIARENVVRAFVALTDASEAALAAKIKREREAA